MNNDADDLIDAHLRQAFAPPPEQHYVEVARGVTRPVRRIWPWLLAVAAAMLLFAVLYEGRGNVRGPEGHDARSLGAMWVAAYDHAIETGFGVGGCCEPSLDLSAKCHEVCGQSLSFHGEGDVRLLGCYCGLPTGGCLGLLLQVRGQPVSVFVMPRDRDPRPVLGSRSGLALQRRELGPLVLYSIADEKRDEVLLGFSL